MTMTLFQSCCIIFFWYIALLIFFKIIIFQHLDFIFLAYDFCNNQYCSRKREGHLIIAYRSGVTCYQIDLFFIRKLCKKNLAWTTKWYLGRVWLLNGVLVVNVWEKSKEKKVMMGFQGLSGGYWKEKTKVFIKELWRKNVRKHKEVRMICEPRWEKGLEK